MERIKKKKLTYGIACGIGEGIKKKAPAETISMLTITIIHKINANTALPVVIS